MADAYGNILQKTFDRKIPFAVLWELTYRCNLSCVHCYATNRRLKGELELRDIESVLAQLAEMGCLFLTFTGGEIFRRRDLLPILTSARTKGFALRLFTNGTLMTPRSADRLVEIEPLSVEISLYSTDPAIHDRITGKEGSHRRTLSAIRRCAARGINTAIKCTLLKYNLSGYRDLRDFAGNIGARFVFDFLLAPADDGSRRMLQHGLSEEQIHDFILANAAPGRQPPAMPDMSAPLCGAGSNTLCISPAGDVFPCLAVRQIVGNVKTRTLRDIWSSSLLENIRSSRYYDVVECRNCDCSPFCSRCAGVAFAECGSIVGKSESACIVARATKRAAETPAPSRMAGLMR